MVLSLVIEWFDVEFPQPDEIYDYWGNKAGPVTWRLTVTEVKKVLALRY